ncbi:MAG TPA: cytochrome ubiquinol oxidase subunit I, partial [Alphaproteobacteria bacterium]|nr:cytochrome ubiquinol oxidase subunit I [Alphaproteobacteria bacterium]
AVAMAAIVAPIQLLVGDAHGLNTQVYQPAKIAAMEGHFETRAGAPLILFGLPDMQAGTTHDAIEIPKLGSLILKHDLEGTVTGLDAFPRADWPNVPIVFFAFRIMVGIGVLMILYGLTGAVLAWRRKLSSARLYLRWALVMGPLGFIALIAGWCVTEVGRQPYIVYGLMRTADASSPIGAPGIAGSLAAFVIVYLTIFAAGVFYMLRLMGSPPETSTPEHGPIRTGGITPEPVLKDILEGAGHGD